MSAGPVFTYLWADDNDSVAPLKVSGNNNELHARTPPRQMQAQEYIDKLLGWVDGKISDAELFPPDEKSYPAEFEDQCKV
jgi:hypothetical protein